MRRASSGQDTRRFSVVDASGWTVENDEPGGRVEKWWLLDPERQRWLYKTVLVKNGHRHGDDWAEKAATELAGLAGIPVAQVELASRDGRPGVLSRDLLPNETWSLHSGAVLIGSIDPSIEPRARSRVGHNLANIQEVLDPLRPPETYVGPSDFTAYDVFCGYLVLDAWVANTDRHEENWSVLIDAAGETQLAPSYDHASSLGFGETDMVRRRVLDGSPGLERWASRGRASRFQDGQGVTLVDFVTTALRRTRPDVGRYWAERLDGIPEDAINDVLTAIPVMSDVTRMFCRELLLLNRRRLLDAC